MFIRKLVTASAVAAFAIAGPAFAADDWGGAQDQQPSTQDQQPSTLHDSTDKQAGSQAGMQELQATVKKVDKSNHKLTFEVPLSTQASIEDKDQKKIQLSELSEGDEVRASFDPVTGDITKLEVVSKKSDKSKKKDSTMEHQGSQPSHEPTGTP